MLKLKVLFLSITILVACQVSFADGPCPGSDPDELVEDCTYEIQSGKLNNERLAIAYTNRAEAWNEKGEFDKAISDSNKALSLYPNYLLALNARGLAWQGKGEYSKAIEDYSALIANAAIAANWFVDISSTYMRRGAACGLKGDLDKALADFSEAIRRNPNAARAYYNRGLAWKQKGEYDKAIADYKKAILVNPADPRGLEKSPKEWTRMSKAEQAEMLFKGLTFSGIVTTSPEIEGVHEVQQTRFGNVLIVGRRKGSHVPDTILFKGQEVFRAGSLYLSFHGKFSIGGTDVLLFGVNCGGSSCSPDELNFLLIRADSEPVVVTTKDFYSADGRIVLKKENDRVVVDLGFEKGKKKTATLQSGKVVINLVPSTAMPMELEDCKRLYKNSSEDCYRLKELKLDCEENGREYSGGSVATMSDYTALSNHPGFVSSALGNICVKTCETGRVVPFDQFKKEVCSIK